LKKYYQLWFEKVLTGISYAYAENLKKFPIFSRSNGRSLNYDFV
jgi:hypothetical protein